MKKEETIIEPAIEHLVNGNSVMVIIMLGLLTVSMVNTYTVIKRFDNLETMIEEQEIIEEPEIQTDFPYKKLGKYELTFYCPCERCVGKKKVVRTATGTIPKANRTIAVDPAKIPLGSIVFIEGYGYFIAEDTGSAIKANKIDIYVNSHEEALQLGRKHANVYLLKEGDK